MKKKVLFVIGNLYSGGVESVSANILSNISKEKFEIDLAVNSIDNSSVFYEHLKKNVTKVYTYGISKDYRTILLSLWKIWNIIKKGNYDIVHTNLDFINSIVLMLAYFAKVKKRISNSHRSMSENERKIFTKRLKYSIRCLLRPFIILFATDKLAVSKMAGLWLYGNNQSFEIISNGVNIERYVYNDEAYIRKRKELKVDGNFVITNIASFETAKNHKFLIDIFENICNKLQHSKLIFVGSGMLERELKDYTVKKKLDEKIIFLGNRNDVPDILKASDVFVFPSISEGFGLAVLEAQTAGLPCFISDQIPKEVNITNTFVLPINESTEYWAKIILEKTENFIRKDSSEKIKGSKFDIKQVVQKIEHIYLK